MHSESTVVLLFCIATAIAVAVRRLSIPYTVALVVAGLVVGSFGLVTPPRLTKELLFTFFLPGLLFEAAFHLDQTAFRGVWKSTFALAVPGVIVGMFVTAALLGPMLQLLTGADSIDWRFSILFGALVAATDPVAVTALFKEVKAPPRLAALVEAESLFNDGTAVVVLGLVYAFLSGPSQSAGSMIGGFVLVAGGGVAVGLIIGFAIAHAIRRLDDAMIEMALTTIAAYGSFVVAEEVGVSGVLATVVAGITCARHGRNSMSPRSHAAVESFWEYVGFALNSIVFLLIGFEFRPGLFLQLWPEIALAFLAMLLARTVLVGTLFTAQHAVGKRMPASWGIVLTWGGLRGALAMVLALALPESVPNRDLLAAVTIGAVVVSLLVQGSTMPLLVRRLHLAEEQRTA